MKQVIDKEKEETKKRLKKLLRKGHYKVYCKLNHVSRSGMLRYIDFYTIVDDRPVYLTGYIDKVTSYKRAPYNARYEGLKVEGCGMDMGFAVVYDLSQTLYGTKHDQAYKLSHRWL